MNQEDQHRLLSLTNFAETVAHMRRVQRAYFQDRKQADLVESKRLEAAVDLRLAELGIKNG